LVVGGPANIPASPEQFERLLPFVALTLTAGPCLAGLLLTGLASGRAGLTELLSRLRRWRMDPRWYAVALLTAPLIMTAIFLTLSLFSREFLPPILTARKTMPPLALAIVTGLAGGFCEELGWTGFAIPRLRRRHSVLATGLIVGVLWGIWHFPVNVWGSAGLSGGVALPVFVPLYLLAGAAQLTAFRVLMVWVYDRTESLFVATLMHAALIFSTVQTVLTPATRGWGFLVWFVLSAGVLWILVGVVALVNGRRLSRPPTGIGGATTR
jgi:membrane protease YdiL (CAAX protease family)